MALTPPRTNRWQSWSNGLVLRLVLGGLCLLALWNVLHRQDSFSSHLTDAQMMAILTTHCPALRQQPDVLGCLPDPTGIRLITDRPALMPTKVAGFPVLIEPPPPHLPPPPGVIMLRPDGPDPQPTLSDCPPGYAELQKYRWRFCNSPANPQPLPTSLMIPPVAGVPYARAETIFQRQDFMQLPGVQSVSLGANGIVVQTTEPALIPSTFEGLPVRTEKPKGVPYLTNHTRTTLLSPLKGGMAIGPSSGPGGGTLGGFVWSGGEPWLVTAAHIFPSKCGDVPPCSANLPLHQCRNTATAQRPGIPVKLAPERTSPAPPTVSTLMRWTQLTNNVTVKADVAAGPVNVNDYPISRRLEDFSNMVTGNVAAPMRGDRITIVSSMSSATLSNRSYESPHALPGQVTAATMHFTNADGMSGTADDGWPIRSCGENTIIVKYQDVFEVEADADPPGSSSTPMSNQINRNYVLEGTSGALVIDGNGDILGMEFGSRKVALNNDILFTRTAYAAKASNIKTALKFEKWVGSETVPVQGNLVSVGRQNKGRPTLRGWAHDPLNPNASLKAEVYVDGKQGTGTKVNWGTATDPMWTITADKAHTGMSGTEKISGKHGLQEWLPPQYSTSPFYLYALAPGDTTGFLLNDSPLTPTWPKGHQAINPRDGDPDENSKPQRIAISVTNDDKNYPPTNYPVHPNAKKAVEEVLKIVWDNNATPSITSININSTLRGPMPDSKKSPHISGRGLDINQINEKPVRCAHPDFATNTDCTALMKNKKSVAENMKTWVTALQDAFWADCRVTEVLGPVRNKTKYGAKPRAKTIRKHRDHIHITAHPITRSTPCPP